MNVALPLMLSGTSRRRAEAEARGWLRRFSVSALEDRRPGEMSVGQGQRVAVARALVTRPRVVFADEPTGSLDSRNAAVVIEMLARTAREHGSAVLLATHSAAVAGVADRELVMRDGIVMGVAR
jgi:putative ABC transport system ATP-binding protein